MIKGAFYEKEITPPLGAIIPGGFDPRYATGVLDRLYAKAAVFSDGQNMIALLVFDACGLSKEMCDMIATRAEEYTGIKPQNIMMCANHTHTGAPIGRWCDKVLPDDEYVQMMCRLGADCITLAYQRLENGIVKFGCGKEESVSFNRNYKLKDGMIMTNPGVLNPDIVEACAGIDPDLPVLYFENENGMPKGAIISFACHQDCTVGDKLEYSGDFSSVLSRELKKVYGEDFVSFFVEGTCGNINCIDVSKELHDMSRYVQIGKILAGETVKTISKAETLSDNRVLCKKEVIQIKKRKYTDEELKEAEEYIKKYGGGGLEYTEFDPLSAYLTLKFSYDALEYSKDKSTHSDVVVQVFHICGCMFYALPGEEFVQFGLYIKDHSPSDKNILATLCNGNFGYIPTRDMFLPHVYESKLCTSSFLEPEAGYIIVEKCIEMAKQL